MMTMKEKTANRLGEVRTRVGDRLEARSIHGGPPRRGDVVAILGSAGHEHYRVRWEENHESIVYPADGVTIVHR